MKNRNILREVPNIYSNLNEPLNNDFRDDFPIFRNNTLDNPLVFLDSAASAQKPSPVIEAVTYCYKNEYANIHRGVYKLSQKATEAYESARENVQRFINAQSMKEIIFTKGATEAINLVATSYGEMMLKPGDEVILSYLEHHANIVPWQLLKQKIGIEIKVIPIDKNGDLSIEKFKELLSPRTRIVSITHGSNVLGTITPAKDIIKLAHECGAIALIDGAQAVAHGTVDVQDLDADFYTFSSHKLYGPTGLGVLYGKADILKEMAPYQGGGDMILSVTFDKTIFAEVPGRFEAGTPHIAGAFGLSAAIEYVSKICMENIAAYEDNLLLCALDKLKVIEGINILGSPKQQAAIISFEVEGIHSHDIGTILDQSNVAVRVGHHCAQPLMDHLGISGTVRASFGIYNNQADIDVLVDTLKTAQEIFN